MSMELARRIQTAVLATKAQGIPIMRGIWGTDWDRKRELWVPAEGYVCALAALLIHEQPKPKLLLINELCIVGPLLGVSTPWIMAFREGFHEWVGCELMPPGAYRLGAWFAAEYADDLKRS